LAKNLTYLWSKHGQILVKKGGFDHKYSKKIFKKYFFFGFSESGS